MPVPHTLSPENWAALAAVERKRKVGAKTLLPFRIINVFLRQNKHKITLRKYTVRLKESKQHHHKLNIDAVRVFITTGELELRWKEFKGKEIKKKRSPPPCV